jgi:hypothetical protein
MAVRSLTGHVRFLADERQTSEGANRLLKKSGSMKKVEVQVTMTGI